jgi:hypothetical protein
MKLFNGLQSYTKQSKRLMDMLCAWIAHILTGKIVQLPGKGVIKDETQLHKK